MQTTTLYRAVTIGLLSLLALFFASHTSWAQVPRIDPTFKSGPAVNPCAVMQAIEQPDGKRLLLGPFDYISGKDVQLKETTVPRNILVRLLAGSNEIDAAFNRNVQQAIFSQQDEKLGRRSILHIALLPNGKILLAVDSRLKLLNADGTPDITFNTEFVLDDINAFVVQPDEKILVAGALRSSPSTFNIVRLESNGRLDRSFTPFTGAAAALALQADGKILVGGTSNLIRLQPSGEIDPSFNAAIPSGTVVKNIAIQPDSKILVATSSSTRNAWPPLSRLLANGSNDVSFNAGTNFNAYSPVYTLPNSVYPLPSSSLVVQPDGRILVATKATTYNGAPIGQVVRLLATGSLDPTFTFESSTLGDPGPNWLQLLSNGQILVAGSLQQYAPAGSLKTGVALLNTDGSRDNTFMPRASQIGSISAIVMQPDGKYIVGGSFSEINGEPAQNLAQLQPDGTVESSFTQAIGVNGSVYALALQSDGNILVGGNFTTIGGVAAVNLVRLLATGKVDDKFTHTLPSGAPIAKITVQPDGQILTLSRTGLGRGLVRLSGKNGQRDVGFNPVGDVNDFVLEPNGTIIVVGDVVQRLKANGAVDPSFTLVKESGYPGRTSVGYQAVDRDTQGRLYVLRVEYTPGGIDRKVVRRSVIGEKDETFDFYFSPGAYEMYCLKVQANNRVLLGGEIRDLTGIRALLPSGENDLAFASGDVPGMGVLGFLEQPDNKLMVVGYFKWAGTTPAGGLVRLLDTGSVLGVSDPNNANTFVWPVPAHSELHLQLDASAHPQRVELLDGLGRVLLDKGTKQAELVVPLSDITPGLYLLRVSYADGTVVRRVVVE